MKKCQKESISFLNICLAIQNVEVSYYKTQNQQLRSLLRHAGLSDIQEFQLIAALSEQTAKNTESQVAISQTDDTPDSQVQKTADEVFKGGEQLVVDLTVDQSDEAAVKKDNKARPGNVISLSKLNNEATSSHNEETCKTQDCDRGWKQSEVESCEVFNVSDDIKQFIRRKMIEIVYKNSSNVFVQLTNALVDSSTSEKSVARKGHFSSQSSQTPLALDLSTLSQIKIGGKTVRLVPVISSSSTLAGLEKEGNRSKSTENTLASRTDGESVLEKTNKATQAVSSEASDESVPTSEPVSMSLVSSNDKEPLKTSRIESGNELLKDLVPSLSDHRNERRVLPSIFSLARIEDDNKKVPSIDEIGTQLQADANLDQAIRSSTLFDIDSLIANHDDFSNPYPINSATFDSSNTTLNEHLINSGCPQELMTASSSSNFSIRNLTSEISTEISMNQRYQSTQNNFSTRNDFDGSDSYRIKKINSAGNVSASKASSHTVEALIMPSGSSIPNHPRSQNTGTYLAQNRKDVPDLNRNLSNARGKELRCLEVNPPHASEFSNVKRKITFENENHNSLDRTKRTLQENHENNEIGSQNWFSPISKKQKTSSNRASQPAGAAVSADKNDSSFAYLPPQYPTQQAFVTPAPLPFWEENMVVMPPQGYGNSFASTGGSFVYPVVTQPCRESITQYQGPYYVNSCYAYDSSSADYSSTGISDYRPSQGFVIPPPALAAPSYVNTANELADPGKYFSNFCQPIAPSFQYSTNSGNFQQQPLEPEVLLQPLTPAEKTNTFRQSSSFSGFKDVEFMARNSSNNISSNSNVAASGPGGSVTFNPFLEGSNAQTFTVEAMQHPSSFQHSFPYQVPSEKSDSNSSRREANEKQTRSNSNPTAMPTQKRSYPSSSRIEGMQQRVTQAGNELSTNAPRHLIKNFVYQTSQQKNHPQEPRIEMNNKNWNKKSLENRTDQSTRASTNVQSNSNNSQFNWSSPSVEPFSVSSSNFLFSNSELPF